MQLGEVNPFGNGPHCGLSQKSYLELLVQPDIFDKMITRIENHPDLTYYAVTKDGELRSNVTSDGPNAVTWGVFPGKEIVQPTIVESISFLAWKDEAFRLGVDWAHCYDMSSPSRALLEGVMNDWYLVNIVNNDFHDNKTIFELLKGLEVKDLTTPATPLSEFVNNGAVDAEPIANGTTATAVAN